jgi:hypothetical protein
MGSVVQGVKQIILAPFVALQTAIGGLFRACRGV